MCEVRYLELAIGLCVWEAPLDIVEWIASYLGYTASYSGLCLMYFLPVSSGQKIAAVRH